MEDHYKSDAIKKLERYGVGMGWLHIKSLSRKEAIRELRKDHPPKTEGDRHTRYKAVLHKHKQGLTIIKIVDTPVYEATITSTCIESILTDDVRTTCKVDFRLKSNPPRDAVMRAKFIQEELEGHDFKAVLQKAQKKYARQLAFEGKAVTEKSFEKNFRLKQIDGIDLEPKIYLGEDYCKIVILVSGQGITGNVQASSEKETPMMRTLIPSYSVHVWAK